MRGVVRTELVGSLRSGRGVETSVPGSVLRSGHLVFDKEEEADDLDGEAAAAALLALSHLICLGLAAAGFVAWTYR